jgi:hypothetical protein
MSKRVAFSDQHLNLDDIALHHSDVEDALRQYYSRNSILADIYIGFTKAELLEQRLEEEDRSCVLSIFAAIEAAFRIDYLKRVYTKQKDNLSRTFRKLYKEKRARVSLVSCQACKVV